MNSILDITNIEDLSKELHGQNKRIVLVGGCFDLLHIGHITLLQEAKKQAQVLVVFLESDKKIQKLKGHSRPLHTQQQRARMLIELRSVDYVILLPDSMTDQDYEKVTKQLRPAIIATTKGSDSLRYIEKQAKENNAAVYLASKIENLSTSHILDVVAKEF